MPRALLVLSALLLPLLAGCLEGPAAPAQGPGLGDDLLPPTPEVVTTPTLLPPGTLFAGEIVFLAARSPGSEAFRVPEGAAALRFSASLSAGIAGEPAVAITLSDPDGRLAAECREGTCSRVVEAPAPGTWALAWAGIASRNATVEVRLLEKVDPPVPVKPTPAQPPDLHPETLYAREYDYAAPAYGGRTHDSLAVRAGFEELVLKGAFAGETPSGNATLRLLDPEGTERARCPVVPGPCDAPARGAIVEGVWRIEYDGKAPVFAKVSVRGESVEPLPPPSNATLLRETHEYPRASPGNRTVGFWVPEGYPRLGFTFGYRVESADLGMPRIILYDSSGAIRALCDVGPQDEDCPTQLVPEPAGLWRILFVGPSAASADVGAFIFGGPPPPRGEPAAPTPSSPTEPTPTTPEG